MFEQLIAGPIVTYGQVEKELYKRKIKVSSVLKGMGVFIFGLIHPHWMKRFSSKRSSQP